VSPTFERGVFCLSFDFELVWGSRDLVGDVAELRRCSRVTREEVFPALLDMLQAHDAVATWATVGHLFLEREESPGRGLVPPDHTWLTAPWFDGVPAGTEAEHPEFYGRSLVLRLRDAGQEIGSHSFSHPIFGDPGCSRECAESDLARCVAEAEALGIQLRSFVFPRNVAGHVGALAKYGFTCWRGVEPAWFHRPALPRSVGRLGHLGSVAVAATPPAVMPTRDIHGMWNIPASASILPVDGVRRLIPLSQRVRRCQRGIDRAVRERRIFHLYTHPINLATAPRPMLDALDEVLAYAAKRRAAGDLEILPMGQIAERASALSASGATTPGGAAPSGRSSAG
jgi:peptidoglycan/xylan/chitin deacetylase (PgdA/CDA1 family)